MREIWKHLLVSCLMGIGIGVSIGVLGGGILRQKDPGHSVRSNETTYRFIHPLLAFDTPKNNAGFGDLETRITTVIEEAKTEGLETVSVYYRNQNVWMGIDEDRGYIPASLYKVPLMIAYYRRAGNDPKILQERILYPTPQAVDAFYTLTPKTAYSLDELIQAMILKSDNGAAIALTSHIGSREFNEVLIDLGLHPITPQDSRSNHEIQPENYHRISAKNYAMFFRILYNATYLDREYSERALELLTRTSYNDGIVAGVPEHALVAHKYGHYIYPDGFEHELHDCGFVYTGQSAYLLCVMTHGKNIDTLTDVIKKISALVFSASR